MLCAIDPSTKKLAFAVGSPAAKAARLFTGELPIAGHNDLARLQQWVSALAALGVTHVAYEIPYLGKNVKSFQRLTEIRAVVEATVNAAGLSFLAVNPTQWQHACLSLRGRGVQGQPRDVVKPLALRYATDVIGAEPATQDLADAVCIYQHAALNVLPTLEGAA